MAFCNLCVKPVDLIQSHHCIEPLNQTEASYEKETEFFFPYLSVGIAQLDSNVSLELVLETDSVDTRYGLHHCRLSMSHMANSSCRENSNTDLQKCHVSTLVLTFICSCLMDNLCLNQEKFVYRICVQCLTDNRDHFS